MNVVLNSLSVSNKKWYTLKMKEKPLNFRKYKSLYDSLYSYTPRNKKVENKSVSFCHEDVVVHPPDSQEKVQQIEAKVSENKPV